MVSSALRMSGFPLKVRPSTNTKHPSYAEVASQDLLLVLKPIAVLLE